MTLRFRVLIEQDEDGAFVAECPNLLGCVSQGKTREEALQAARRLDPNVTEAQIVPAVATVTFTYRVGGANARFTPRIVHGDDHNVVMRHPQPVQPNP